MRGSESVVDVNVTQAGQLLREVVVVLLFLRMEAKVLEQQHVAIRQRGDLRLRWFADTVVGKRDRAIQQTRKMFGDWTQRVFLDALALRSSQGATRGSRAPAARWRIDGRQ